MTTENKSPELENILSYKTVALSQLSEDTVSRIRSISENNARQEKGIYWTVLSILREFHIAGQGIPCNALARELNVSGAYVSNLNRVFNVFVNVACRSGKLYDEKQITDTEEREGINEAALVAFTDWHKAVSSTDWPNAEKAFDRIWALFKAWFEAMPSVTKMIGWSKELCPPAGRKTGGSTKQTADKDSGKDGDAGEKEQVEDGGDSINVMKDLNGFTALVTKVAAAAQDPESGLAVSISSAKACMESLAHLSDVLASRIEELEQIADAVGEKEQAQDAPQEESQEAPKAPAKPRRAKK